MAQHAARRQQKFATRSHHRPRIFPLAAAREGQNFQHQGARAAQEISKDFPDVEVVCRRTDRTHRQDGGFFLRNMSHLTNCRWIFVSQDRGFFQMLRLCVTCRPLSEPTRPKAHGPQSPWAPPWDPMGPPLGSHGTPLLGTHGPPQRFHSQLFFLIALNTVGGI